MRLTFLGANGTVTGSRHLLENGRGRLLVDCGLFQGLKNLRLRNWSPFPVPAEKLGSVLLTHAHLDHSGYLPRLLREGFQGPVFASAATLDLLRLLLPDSARLMEEEAEHARRHGYSKHTRPKPLYTVRDAERTFRRFTPLAWKTRHSLPGGYEVTLHAAGHILGAAFASIRCGKQTITFSGDLGRLRDALLPDPEPPPASDYVVIESTYGNRTHPSIDPLDSLEKHIVATHGRGGKILIPAFAVGRTQSILHALHVLRSQKRIPALPVYVDSPMATHATELYEKYAGDHRLDQEAIRLAFRDAHYVQDHLESLRLTEKPGPCLILSASGMATGGRVLAHIQACAGDPRNLILFSGFQAAGTRGADLVAGNRSIKIHGEYVEVRCEVAQLENASAHADAPALIDWLGKIPRPPKRVFVVHGEPAAADALRRRITDALGFPASVPEYLERVEL